MICNTSIPTPYPDRFIGPDVLRYVGQGFDGDQEMTRDNESLRQAIERGLEIRVFEAVAKNQYRDHGRGRSGRAGVSHRAAHRTATVVFTLRHTTLGEPS